MRAKVSNEIDLRTNRVSAVLTALSRGDLCSELVGEFEQLWGRSPLGGDSGPCASTWTQDAAVPSSALSGESTAPTWDTMAVRSIRERVGRAVMNRPTLPEPAALLRRLNSGSGPMKGDLCDGDVSLVALPPPGTRPLIIGSVSEKAREWLLKATTRMWSGAPTIASSITTYFDERLKSGILQLAVRMARAGMLAGCTELTMETGMFCVVKKTDGEDITAMRLVFDMRVANEHWVEPPWVPLPGPGSLASADLSAVTDEHMAFAFGDLPDAFYRWSIGADLARFFGIPGLRYDDLRAELKKVDGDALNYLESVSPPNSIFVGMHALVMGWSWAVFFAQLGLTALLQKAPVQGLRISFDARSSFVEGGSQPDITGQGGFHVAYIDDFGICTFVNNGDRALLDQNFDIIVEYMGRFGFPIHKVERGSGVDVIGIHIDGMSWHVLPQESKRWSAIYRLEFLAGTGWGSRDEVQSVLGLATWICLINRPMLSVLEETFHFRSEDKRVSKRLVNIPKKVRTELANLAALLLITGQDLRARWCEHALVSDASEEGGAGCVTETTAMECKQEARFATRGAFCVYQSSIDQDLAVTSRDLISGLPVVVARGLSLRVAVFLHVFSGRPREGDLGWYASRVGGLHGFKVVVRAVDLEQGDDLTDARLSDSIVEDLRSGRIAGLHIAPPCSTWSRARHRPGGPPPLRDHTALWGLPRLSRRHREQLEAHNTLARVALRLCQVAQERGVPWTLEHPRDLGPPAASIWRTDEVQTLQLQCDKIRCVEFDQCMFGSRWLKPTTVMGNLNSMDPLGWLCDHVDHHPPLCGRVPGSENFMTRGAQEYPEGLCKTLAECHVEAWRARESSCPMTPDAQSVVAEEGDRLEVPEVSSSWDSVRRWTVLAQWKWMHPEHINSLEARAAIVSLRALIRLHSTFNVRILAITDSKVVLGAFAKGRSSSHLLNRSCRRLAAWALACNLKIVWRYIRSWRNPADGPSRELLPGAG